MKREELIRSKTYWITQFQIKLFETVKKYLKENNLTQSQFADQIGVNKSYISQILNGDFDHKISKYVDLIIACEKVPILNTINIEDYVNDDVCQFKPVLYTSIENGIFISNEKVKRTNKIEPFVEISYVRQKDFSNKEGQVYY